MPEQALHPLIDGADVTDGRFEQGYGARGATGAPIAAAVESKSGKSDSMGPPHRLLLSSILWR